MATYTFQKLIDSGNWAHPQPDDVSHSASLSGLRNSLEFWGETVERTDDPMLCSLMVWKGFLDDITDQYPDFILRFGPRGGVIKEPC